MATIRLICGRIALVDDCDYEDLSKFTWRAMSGKYPYPCRSITGGTVLMHREIMRPGSDTMVDHINGNRLDNRRENLRLCSRTQNGQNRCKGKNNKSGIKGAYYRPDRGKWASYITVNKEKIFLGYFETKEMAGGAYERAAKLYFGEFASTAS